MIDREFGLKITLKQYVKAALILNILIFSSAFSQLKEQLPKNEIEIGGALLHLRDLYQGSRGNKGLRYYVKPMLVLAHKGYIAGYFKNSHWRDSFFIGLRKYWQIRAYKNITILPGYSFGAVTGYCKGDKYDLYDDCHNGQKWQIAPYGQLFLKFKKNNFSLNLSYSLVLIYITASYYFE